MLIQSYSVHATTPETIGHTPAVRLRRLTGPEHAQVVVKLESVNPTGSYKDQMALAMIEQAEARGALRDTPRRGLSSALNVVGAIRLARELGPGHTVATVAVDTGLKYLAGDLHPALVLPEQG